MDNDSRHADDEAAAAHERLLKRSEQAESLEFLCASLEDADQGRTRPMREMVESLGIKRE